MQKHSVQVWQRCVRYGRSLTSFSWPATLYEYLPPLLGGRLWEPSSPVVLARSGYLYIHFLPLQKRIAMSVHTPDFPSTSTVPVIYRTLSQRAHMFPLIDTLEWIHAYRNFTGSLVLQFWLGLYNCRLMKVFNNTLSSMVSRAIDKLSLHMTWLLSSLIRITEHFRPLCVLCNNKSSSLYTHQTGRAVRHVRSTMVLAPFPITNRPRIRHYMTNSPNDPSCSRVPYYLITFVCLWHEAAQNKGWI